MIEKTKKAPIDSIDKKPSRLRGTLLATAVGERAARLAVTSLGPHASERMPEDRTDLVELGLPGLTGSTHEVTSVLDGEAMLLVDAQMSGLWHYSSGRIDRFSEEVAENSSGKFGRGTYLGAGDLKGETVDFLKGSDTVRHEVAFTGNVMVVDRWSVVAVAERMKVQRGLPPSRFKSSTPTSPLTDLTEGVEYQGRTVDAILVLMDKERTSAELVVIPKAVRNVTVLN